MSGRDASPTALRTAYLRAAHQLLDAPPRILEDPVAVALLGPDAERRIRETADRYGSAERRALRAHVVLRSRFAEDRLAAAGLAMPGNADFATIDFEHESLREGLLRHGISLDAPTFFSRLGVTMYLPEDAIDGVLGQAAAFPEGSEIVLTFARPRDDGPLPTARRAESLGESWRSTFEPAAIEAKLRDAGFTDVAFLTPAEAEARYFRGRPADLPVLRQTNVVSAVR